MTTYLANLDFDDRLAGRAGGSQPRPGPPDENAVLWRVIAAEGDEILVPGLSKPILADAVGPFPAVTFRPPKMSGEVDFIPWGLDDLAQRLASGRFPDEMVAVVKRLNDRRFAYDCLTGVFDETKNAKEIEAVSDPLVSGSSFVTDPEEILPRAAAGELLMLKPRHGGFGRGLRRVLGPDSNPNLVGWVHARCREGGLIVEPLLTAIPSEWACHWQLGPCGTEVETCDDFLGMTSLRCEVRGQFQESDSRSPTAVDQACVANGLNGQHSSPTLPRPIRESGYGGPLSIDMCRYVWDGQAFAGTLRDINARWTVGRLALDAARIHGTRIRLARISRTDDLSAQSSSTIVIPALEGKNRPRWCVHLGG